MKIVDIIKQIELKMVPSSKNSIVAVEHEGEKWIIKRFTSNPALDSHYRVYRKVSIGFMTLSIPMIWTNSMYNAELFIGKYA